MNLRSLWGGNRQPTAATPNLPTWAISVATPQQLLQEEPCPRLLRELREMAGLPDAHWQHLVLSALQRYAAYTQRLDTEDDLKSVLERVKRALRVRRSRLLPPGAGPEIVSQYADRWTYAVLTGSLLQNIERNFLNRRVEGFDATGRSLGYWNPWKGPLCEMENCIAYLPETLQEKSPTTEQVLLFTSRIVPNDGIAWLAEDFSLFCLWKANISGRWKDAGPLGDVLMPSHTHGANVETGPSIDSIFSIASPEPAPAYVQANSPEETDTIFGKCDSSATSANIGEQFLDWLRTSLKNGTLEINTEQAIVFGLENSRVLLSSPEIFRHFVSQKSSCESWEIAQKKFQKLGLHIKGANGSNIHRYKFKNRKAINGFVVPEKAVRATTIKPGPLMGPLQ